MSDINKLREEVEALRKELKASRAIRRQKNTVAFGDRIGAYDLSRGPKGFVEWMKGKR